MGMVGCVWVCVWVSMVCMAGVYVVCVWVCVVYGLCGRGICGVCMGMCGVCVCGRGICGVCMGMCL